jgi:hypothetical protein
MEHKQKKKKKWEVITTHQTPGWQFQSNKTMGVAISELPNTGVGDFRATKHRG